MKICLLGEFALEIDGKLRPGPKPQKARLLLAYLALHPPHVMDRRRLGEILWEDVDSDASLFNLRQTLGTIRREHPELSSLIVAPDRRTLGLNMDIVGLDVADFRRMSKSSPRQALELYSGPLLQQHHSEWITPIRFELEQTYLAALESAADASDPREAVRLLRLAIEVDPFREQTQQKLLIRLAKCGDTAGLTLSYRRFQSHLHNEIHARPSAQTRHLYRHLLNEVPELVLDEVHRNPIASRLPIPPTSLIGREAEIVEACCLIDSSRVVSLLGPGGVGKTRLAIAIGEVKLNTFPAGVWFVDLASLFESNLVAQTICYALGLREHSDRPWPDLLVDLLSGPSRLLILDNCEHLIEGCFAILSRLIASCPNLTILATSRVPLGLEEEHRFLVEPLLLPTADFDGKDWERYSAIALFASRAKRSNPKFRVQTDNLQTVISICKHVDAIPLGIEMTAAILAAVSLDELATRLESSSSFLRSPISTVERRHRTLTDVVDWSYSLLAPDERLLLRKLSVFQGWWTLAHVETAFGDQFATPVVATFVRLVEASLIQSRDGRYSLFEVVRQYAVARLESECEEEDARNRHLNCVVRQFEGARQTCSGQDAGGAASRYEADLENARQAMEWSIVSGATEQGLLLVADVAIVMGMLGLDANKWLARLLAIPVPDPGSVGRLAALRTACWSYSSAEFGISQANARRRSARAIEELMELARAKNDVSELSWALASLGQMLVSTDPVRAESMLHEALELNESMDLPETEAFIRITLASIALNRGAYGEAESLLAQVITLGEKSADSRMVAGAIRMQGLMEKERGAYPRAKAKLEKARSLAHNRRSVYEVRCASQFLVELYVDSGQWEMLSDELTRAIPGRRDHGDWLSTNQVDTISRLVAAHDERYFEAADGLSDLIDAFVRKGREEPSPGYRWAGLGLEILARCLAAGGRKADAAKVFGAAQSMSSQDAMVVSPSIRHRWDRLALEAGLSEFEIYIDQGRAHTTSEAVELAEVLEPEITGLTFAPQ